MISFCLYKDALYVWDFFVLFLNTVWLLIVVQLLVSAVQFDTF